MPLNTERLTLRWFTFEDAPFILRLLNEPSFLNFIGDKCVRNLADARAYIENGPMKSYAEHGFGLQLVMTEADQTPIGMCGLLKRPSFANVEIGYAFLQEHWSNGYAIEAAKVVLNFGKEGLGIKRVIAITSMDNGHSISLLIKLGFTFEQKTKLDSSKDEVNLYGIQF